MTLGKQAETKLPMTAFNLAGLKCPVAIPMQQCPRTALTAGVQAEGSLILPLLKVPTSAVLEHWVGGREKRRPGLTLPEKIALLIVTLGRRPLPLPEPFLMQIPWQLVKPLPEFAVWNTILLRPRLIPTALKTVGATRSVKKCV